MHLEKMIKVKTFIAPQGYEDEIAMEGFAKGDILQQDYIKILKELNRAFLRKSEVQEVTIVMSYHKEDNNSA